MKIKYLGCGIVYLLLILFSISAYAFSWQDLWMSKNQQAKEMMRQRDFNAAKNTFKDDNWRAVAAFRAKDYNLAADLFAKSTAPDADYNLGNALANLGKYPEAIAAYAKALATNKNNKDAQHNKELLEKLLQQKQQQAKDNKPQEQKQEPSEQNNSGNKSDSNAQNNANANTQQQDQKPKDNESVKDTKDSKQQNINNQKEQSAHSPEGGNQMQEQWLKLVPDDPGGLLREKFRRDYLRKRGELNS